MNEFDQFVKHRLKAKHYIRYADDFVFLSHDKPHLLKTLRYIEVFLLEQMKLELHPHKVSLTTLASGIDFLGWVHFPSHRVLRTTTKRRMLKALEGSPEEPVVAAYRGMLGWGNGYKLLAQIPKVGQK